MSLRSIFFVLGTMITYLLSVMNETLHTSILCGLLAIAWAISELKTGDEDER